MASFRFTLKNPKATSKTPIRLQVVYGTKETAAHWVKIYIGESVKPLHWNQKSQRVKGIKTAPEINGKLDRIAVTADNVLRKYKNEHDNQDPPPGLLKELIEVAINRRSAIRNLDFFGYFEEYIELQRARRKTEGKPIGRSIVNDYERTLALLREFSRRLSFESINETWYHSFVNFLRDSKEFRTNTIGKHLKNLKAFLNWATEEEYNDNRSFQKGYYKILKAESVNYYLDEGELKIMRELEFKGNKAHLKGYRDAFLIACWTGLRYSDFSRLTPENIDYEEGVIRIKTKKTGAPVVIPFVDELREVMEEYKEKPLPVYRNQPMNRYLKEIGLLMSEKVKELNINGEKKQKDYSKLTTHTGRRSFCSNMYYRGVDIEMIMAISGHRTEKQFREYIKVEGEDKAKRFLQQAQERKPVVNLKIAR
jgi:site-specific recombinase XerD